jgi:hypothetical protein
LREASPIDSLLKSAGAPPSARVDFFDVALDFDLVFDLEDLDFDLDFDLEDLGIDLDFDLGIDLSTLLVSTLSLSTESKLN